MQDRTAELRTQGMYSLLALHGHLSKFDDERLLVLEDYVQALTVSGDEFINTILNFKPTLTNTSSDNDVDVSIYTKKIPGFLKNRVKFTPNKDGHVSMTGKFTPSEMASLTKMLNYM